MGARRKPAAKASPPKPVEKTFPVTPLVAKRLMGLKQAALRAQEDYLMAATVLLESSGVVEEGERANFRGVEEQEDGTFVAKYNL